MARPLLGCQVKFQCVEENPAVGETISAAHPDRNRVSGVKHQSAEGPLPATVAEETGIANMRIGVLGSGLMGAKHRVSGVKHQSAEGPLPATVAEETGIANMRIGVLGSGLMGAKLGTIFARAGHRVIFSYARSEQKLHKLAREAGGNARAGEPAEAARESDVLLIAVHWSRIDDVFRQAGDLREKLIITCSLPMNEANTELVIAHTSSGAEELARKAPKARVVCAFNTVPSEVLFAVFEARGRTRRPSLAYCGDDEAGKATAAELIADSGFDPVDAGPLRIARYTEPFALLIAQLAYEGNGGPKLAYRFERFR